jgi:hypothetical protein
MAVTLSFSFNAKRASTRFMRLQIRGVPAGATVHVTCAPKRCPKGLTKHGYTKTNAPAVVSLAQFVKKPLMAKTIITAVISKPGFITTVKRLEVRRSKAPRVTTSCQTPGTPAATPC